MIIYVSLYLADTRSTRDLLSLIQIAHSQNPRVTTYGRDRPLVELAQRSALSVASANMEHPPGLTGVAHEIALNPRRRREIAIPCVRDQDPPPKSPERGARMAACPAERPERSGRVGRARRKRASSLRSNDGVPILEPATGRRISPLTRPPSKEIIVLTHHSPKTSVRSRLSIFDLRDKAHSRRFGARATDRN